MKLAHPSITSTKLYLAPDGPRFRPNSSNPKVLWGKLAPVQADEVWGRIVYHSNYIMLVDNAAPMLLAMSALPPGAPIPDLHRATTTPSQAIHKCLVDYEHLRRLVDGHKPTFRAAMDSVIYTLYQGGASIDMLCTLFQVGRTRVASALRRVGVHAEPETEEQKRRKVEMRKKNELLQQVRADDRYEALKAMDNRMRARAKALQVECSYDRETLLNWNSGNPSLPNTCPVLSLALRYIESTGDKSAYPDATAVIARRDPTQPFVNGNVLIMSRLASRLIENTIGIAAKTRALENPDILRAWAAWRDKGHD